MERGSRAGEQTKVGATGKSSEQIKSSFPPIPKT